LESVFSPGQLPALVADPERRAALQWSFLQRFPKVRMPCCGGQMCFRCRIRGWHPESCEARQRSEMCQEVKFCPHCKVPTIKSEGCSHMVCVCGKDWNWDYCPLMQALEADDIETIERLLLELPNVNDPLQSVRVSPMDYYLSMLGEASHPGAHNVVKLFARLAARASPAAYAETLHSAVRRADLQLVKVLLELFVGIGDICLLDALEVALEGLCASASARHLSGWKSDLTQIALKLIDAGAPVGDAADIFFQMSAERRQQCPVELAQVLSAAPKGSICIAAQFEADEEKTFRAAKMSTMRLMSSRRQVHKQYKHAKLATLARGKGGRRKVGESLVNSAIMF